MTKLSAFLAATAFARVENDSEVFPVVEGCCRKGSVGQTSARCAQRSRSTAGGNRGSATGTFCPCLGKRGIRFTEHQFGAVDAGDSPEILQRVRAGLPIVDHIVKSLAPWLGRSIEIDDLAASGRAGLLAAARRFDPSRGHSFEGYATYRVRGAIMDAARRVHGRVRLRAANADSRTQQRTELRAHAHRSRATQRPRSVQSLAETLGAMGATAPLGVVFELADIEDDELFGIDDSDPEQMLSMARVSAFLRRVVRKLPQEEAEIIRRHYFRGEQLDVIAEDLELSPSWVSRLQKQAIERLRKRVQGAPIAELHRRGTRPVEGSV